METIIAFAKRKGFVFPSSEIYDGLAGVYDFGPHGTALLQALKAHFRQKMVREKANFYEIDSAVFKHPRVWDASGHTTGFSDPIVECRDTQTRLRVDKELADLGVEADEKMSLAELQELFDEHHEAIAQRHKLPGNFTPVRAFNLLVTSNLGDFTGDHSGDRVYLPGEACQGIYLNYKNVLDTMHPKIPFGISQIGKAFRNEISPRRFLFRTREFEQADTQYFVRPGEGVKHLERIRQERWEWHLSLGLSSQRLRWKQHEHLVFYAREAWDIEYDYPSFGFDEVEGIHDRTDYDLTQHMKFSGQDLHYKDNGEPFIPHILETSLGLGRLFLAVLSEAYREETLPDGETRIVLGLKPFLAPVQVAVLPLMKKDGLAEQATILYNQLTRRFRTSYDESGSIGKRYRRADEIGTPYCLTVDHDTLSEGTVTIRHRDSMEQIRLALDELEPYLAEKLLSESEKEHEGKSEG